ncbi:MAG: hypothetical protein GXO21_08585 [Aquificae bacterium]|nr:hypothetical protein [Aquificota bacterium]
MKDVLRRLRPIYIFLLMFPFLILGVILFFKKDIESHITAQIDKLFLKTTVHKKYSPSFVLKEYNPISSKTDLVSKLLMPSPLKQKKIVYSNTKESIENLKINFIYIGKNKYVIINGILYKEGDLILGRYKVDRIEKGRVKISRGSNEKWLYIY